MRNSNVTILTVFMIIAALLLAATIFHWKYRSRKREISLNRVKMAQNIQRQFYRMNRATNNILNQKGYLHTLFKKSPYILFLAMYNDRQQPLFFQSRLDRNRTIKAIRLINKREISRRDLYKFIGKNFEGFSALSQLPNRENGRVILLFNSSIYENVHAIVVRQFIIFALIIVLFGVLVPIVLTRLSFIVKKREIVVNEDEEMVSPEEPTKNIQILQERNSILEKEIERLADFRDINFTAASQKDCQALIEYIHQIAKLQLNAENVTTYIENSHVVHSMDNLSKIIKIIPKRSIERMHKVILDTSFSGKEKIILPLTANENIYGMVKISHPKERDSFSTEDIRKFSQLINQVSLHLYNFILYEIALTDSLTGLFSRRHFDKKCTEEIFRTMRCKIPFSLAMIDIDHFKTINDTYGHATGDIVLQKTAQTVKEAIRRTDHAFRFGGEEFAIILPETTLESAAELMEKIRQKIAGLTFESCNGNRLTATASFGITNYNGEQDIGLTEMINQADKALYFSKKNGRNMVSRHSTSIALKEETTLTVS